MKKLMLIASLAVIVGAFWLVLSVSAQDTATPPDPEDNFDTPPPGGPESEFTDPGFGCERIEWLKEELGLTDEQINKFDSLRIEHMKAQIEFGAKLKVAYLDLAELIKTRGNDEAVLKKSAEIAALRNQMADVMIRHQLKRRAIFTDEQWNKVTKLFCPGGHMNMRHDGRGMGFRRPGMDNRNFDRPFHRFRDDRPQAGRVPEGWLEQ